MSIKIMVPYNGPALVEGLVLVGRKLTKITCSQKRAGFFLYFLVGDF